MIERVFGRGVRPLREAILPADEAEAATWADGTRYTKEDILRAYRTHLRESSDPLDIQRFCEDVLKIENIAGGGE